MNKTWKSLKKHTLMDIVIQVLSREGLSGLTMDSIAREAGVAKGTLYSYFKNKQDLVKEAIDSAISPLVEELHQILETDLRPDERLKRMTLRHLAYFEENRDFFKIFMHDRLAAQQRLKRYRNCYYHEFVQHVANVIEEGIRAKIFRELESQKIAAMLVEADIALIFQRLLTDQPGSVEKDAALISDIFLHGIQRNG